MLLVGESLLSTFYEFSGQVRYVDNIFNTA
jgi:hypothetical protein